MTTYEMNLKILMNKINLKKSDYYTLKYAEGELSQEKFDEIKLQRKKWRDEINQLEKQIEELNQDL